MKKLIEHLKYCSTDADCIGCDRWEVDYGSRCCINDLLQKAAEAIEKLNARNDELLKEVSWLKSCKNCKIYSECPRHDAKTVHGCDHWVDVCGERKSKC